MNKDTNSLQRILDNLHSKDFQTRHQAIKSIAEHREISAIPNLISLLNDKDWSIQISAVKALGEIGDSQAVPSLIEALLRDDEWVATYAAEALGKIGDVRATTALLKALSSQDLLNHFEESLKRREGKIDSATYVAIGQAYFEISDLRCAAAHALGQIGDEQAITELAKALNDPHDLNLQKAAAQALDKIGTFEALTITKVWQEKQNSNPSNPS